MSISRIGRKMAIIIEFIMILYSPEGFLIILGWCDVLFCCYLHRHLHIIPVVVLFTFSIPNGTFFMDKWYQQFINLYNVHATLRMETNCFVSTRASVPNESAFSISALVCKLPYDPIELVQIWLCTLAQLVHSSNP